MSEAAPIVPPPPDPQEFAPSIPAAPLHAFAGVGIELEFMIVDARTLAVQPLADQLLRADGKVCNEIERGALGWSNELALHVLEVKNLRPSPALAALPAAFQREIDAIEARLAPLGARLMPGAMHPWMDPQREMRLWPHDNQPIYQAYDRIFDCRGHGWTNLQSMHVNLPFGDDAEFARLHAAVRLVLPLLPALAAASPVADGADTGWADYRMHVYAHNARKFPAITGKLVPETITSRAHYEARILQPMYRAIAPHDPARVLRREWLNSRGAIARFDRNAIEIRVIDTQECVLANFAVAAAAVAAIRMLYEAGDETGLLGAQQEVETSALAAILQDCMRHAERARIENGSYLRLLGMARNAADAGEVWRHLLERWSSQDPDAFHWLPALRIITEQGPLARRIQRALNSEAGVAPSRARLEAVYGDLCDCLRENRMFEGRALGVR